LPAEVATAFELDRLIAQEVRIAKKRGEFPLVLSGNCNSAVGTISGAGALGIVWFDGHADFNTPETTTTGFSDDTGLAIAAGHCWTSMAKSIPGFEPVPEANVVLVGTRDIEPAEQERLDDSDVTVAGAGIVRKNGVASALGGALDDLRTRVDRVYVHLDLDVLDPETLAPANEFAPPDGLLQAEIEEALQLVGERFTVAAAGIASYDPAFDAEGEILRAGSGLAKTLAAPHGLA
jgi:arginase